MTPNICHFKWNHCMLVITIKALLWMHLVDDHLVPSHGILHIYVTFYNSYNIRVYIDVANWFMYHPFHIPIFIFFNLPLFYAYKRKHWLVCRTHNKREISYIFLEELVSHIAFSLSYLVIFFDFTTRYQHEALANCCVLLIFNIKSHL